MCSLPSHDLLLLSIIRKKAHSSGKKDHVPNMLIIPMKHSLASFIKIKLVAMQTFTITRGVIIDFSNLLVY